MSSSAMGASAISPFRTPRERAWPSPTMLSASPLSSPTTAQTLEVPISRPTIMEEGSNIFLFVAKGAGQSRRHGRQHAGLQKPGGNVVAHRQIQTRDRFAGLASCFVDLPPSPY